MESRNIDLENGTQITFYTSSTTSDYFDTVVGHIEDVVVEEEFQKLQKDFFEKYWEQFEDDEENKLEYMDIFKEWTQIIENFIIDELTKRVDNFNMDKFLKELELNRNNLDGEIFDLLLSFSNFLIFKELMLDYRASKEGIYPSMDFDLTVTKIPSEHFLNNDTNIPVSDEFE